MELLNLDWVLSIPLKSQLALLKKSAANNRDAFVVLVQTYINSPVPINPIIETSMKDLIAARC